MKWVDEEGKGLNMGNQSSQSQIGWVGSISWIYWLFPPFPFVPLLGQDSIKLGFSVLASPFNHLTSLPCCKHFARRAFVRLGFQAFCANPLNDENTKGQNRKVSWKDVLDWVGPEFQDKGHILLDNGTKKWEIKIKQLALSAEKMINCS